MKSSFIFYKERNQELNGIVTKATVRFLLKVNTLIRLNTVKFLNFGTLENFAVIILKLVKRGFTIE